MTASRHTLRTASELVGAGLATADSEADLARVAARYAVAITPAMADLIDPADARDPIARQFVPDLQELDRHPAEEDDPIGDMAKSPTTGLVHRYRDRVLLKISAACPVYCRFCFRRETIGPGKAAPLSEPDLDAAISYLHAHPEVWEVILTGGDPLVLAARRIRDITLRLQDVSHIKVLRWHTRVPAVAPHLVDDVLIGALKSGCQSIFVALHANHPRELTPAARAALARLADNGISLVSQTVLLRGINDNADTLEALMRAFVEARVKPYYLHHGDLAPGTAHFRTTIAEGQALMRELRGRLSGLALPTYVLDIPGAHGKVPIGPVYLSGDGDPYLASDASGADHGYRDCCR